MPIKKSTIGYVKIKSLPHYGEAGVPTGRSDGERAEFRLLDCAHGLTTVWLRREEI